MLGINVGSSTPPTSDVNIEPEEENVDQITLVDFDEAMKMVDMNATRAQVVMAPKEEVVKEAMISEEAKVDMGVENMKNQEKKNEDNRVVEGVPKAILTLEQIQETSTMRSPTF